MPWKTGTNQIVTNLDQSLISAITKNDYDKRIIVGCDSQIIDNHVSFVTTITVIYVGHGGVFFYNKQISQNNGQYNNLSYRLFDQTYKAVNTAKTVDEIIGKIGFSVSQIHCDLNNNKKYKSFKSVSACIGYINGNGYKAVIKPDAFGASCIADSLTR